MRIINEPTAAAIAYAHTKNAQGNVLVFDLGGGTFDVTIMRVADHAYDILATDGNHVLVGLTLISVLWATSCRSWKNKGSI